MSAVGQVAMPFIGLCLLLIVHGLVHRARRRRNAIFRSFFLALPVAAALLILLELRLPVPDTSWPSLLVDLGVFLGLAYAYLELLSLGCSSIRLRILAELDRRPGGLTREQLLARYSARDIIEMRLERLIGSGAARESCGRLHDAGSSALLLMRLTLFLRWLFFGATTTPRRGGSSGDVVGGQQSPRAPGDREE